MDAKARCGSLWHSQIELNSRFPTLILKAKRLRESVADHPVYSFQSTRVDTQITGSLHGHYLGNLGRPLRFSRARRADHLLKPREAKK
jgi:hypothetical protein